MVDIVERLNDDAQCFCPIRKEAADEIERLREALEKICNGQRDADLSYAELFAEVKIEARAALKGDE